MKQSGDIGLAKYVIPQVLIQINSAYNHNPDMEEYTGFAVDLEITLLTMFRATMSREYIQSLRAGGPVRGELPLHYYYHDGRREFPRLFVGC